MSYYMKIQYKNNIEEVSLDELKQLCLELGLVLETTNKQMLIYGANETLEFSYYE